MTTIDYRLFDADEHYYEPEDALTRHLDRKYRSAVRWVDMDGRRSLIIGGKLLQLIPNPTYDPVGRPEVSNLLTVVATCEGTTPEQVAEEIGDGGGGGLKARVTEAVNTYFAPLRERRREIEGDPAYVESVLRQGNERANEVAEATLDEVRTRMGMVYA